jgi:hypothetical protein
MIAITDGSTLAALAARRRSSTPSSTRRLPTTDSAPTPITTNAPSPMMITRRFRLAR